MASSFLTSALYDGHHHVPVAFFSGDRAIGNHLVMGQMSPRVRLDAIQERKSVALAGNRSLNLEAHTLLAEPTESLQNILMTF
jgi:D-aminopeptidase